MSIESVMRGLAFLLAAVVAAVAAILPPWLVMAVLNPWLSGVNYSHGHALPLNLAVWAMVGGVAAIKHLLPLLVVLSSGEARVGITLMIAWLCATATSTLAVVRAAVELIPAFTQLRLADLAGVAAIWLCVEIVGTLGIPAIISTMRKPTTSAPANGCQSARWGDWQRPASAPSAVTAEEVLVWLREIASSAPGAAPRGLQVRADGSICASHRQLALAIGLPRTNLVRRLSRLQRAGLITMTSTRDGSVIHVSPAGVP